MNNSDLAFDHVRSTLTGECFTVGPGGDACLQCTTPPEGGFFAFIDRSLLIIAKQMVVC